MLLLEQFENLTLHSKNAARLKELVLQLAVQGKLTENWRMQNPDVEPAAELLEQLIADKAQLVKEKKIKKEDPLPAVTEDEVPYTLPESWVWGRLGDLFEIVRGSSPRPKGDSRYFATEKTDFNWIKISDITAYTRNKYLFSTDEYLTEEGTKFSRKVGPKDIIIAASGSVGKACLLDIEGYIYDGLMAVRGIEAKATRVYLLLFFKTIELALLNTATGTSWKNINTDILKNSLIPLPPLAEQEAIVARVEELMQKIEELEKQTAERIQLKQHLGAAALQQLTAATDEELEQNWLFLKQHFQTMFDEAANVKKLRETILQLAVQGKLTATWRTQNPTTEPASELLKRIQAEKAKLVKEKKIKKEKPLEPISEDEVPYTLPEGWVWCRMADIASKLGAGSTPKGGKEVYVEEGIPFLRSQNVYDDGLRLNGVAQITEAVHQKMSGTHVQPKDILLNITGGSIGRCALVADDFDTANVSQHVAIIRLVDSGIRKYVHYLMTSDMIQRLIMDVQVGVSREGLSMTKLREFLIPLPPLSEQEAIVAKVGQLMQLCDELEQQIQQSKKEAEALMQAVVQEALQVQEEVEL